MAHARQYALVVNVSLRSIPGVAYSKMSRVAHPAAAVSPYD
jgi:hypothetical protein